MSLTLTVGLFSEPSFAVASAEDDALWRHRIAEVEQRLSGIGWRESRLIWGIRAFRWHLSEEECSTTFDSDLFGCPGDLYEEAEGVYTALCFGSRLARLDRPRDEYDSDPYGYAVPVRFTGFYDNVGRFDDAFVVSSDQLIEECERLAALLELPTRLGPADIRATLQQPTGRESVPKWQRFGVESVVCATLLNAARCSMRTGCAVVFT